MMRSKWKIAHLGLITSGFCIALAGCATAPPATREVPVVERSTTVETPPDRPALSQQAPASVPKAPPSSGAEAPQQPSLEPATLPETPVVLALLDTADRQKQAGQLPAAAASLERALRIEPRNPETWYQLAIIRFHQGQFGQAEQLARKAEALAGRDNAARARSWLLIAAARQQVGDREGAHRASERAAGLTGSD
ncbi:MAG: tetratricopeptide repeat protein [Gammaproteobacteria bacterium]